MDGSWAPCSLKRDSTSKRWLELNSRWSTCSTVAVTSGPSRLRSSALWTVSKPRRGVKRFQPRRTLIATLLLLVRFAPLQQPLKVPHLDELVQSGYGDQLRPTAVQSQRADGVAPRHDRPQMCLCALERVEADIQLPEMCLADAETARDPKRVAAVTTVAPQRHGAAKPAELSLLGNSQVHLPGLAAAAQSTRALLQGVVSFSVRVPADQMPDLESTRCLLEHACEHESVPVLRLH